MALKFISAILKIVLLNKIFLQKIVLSQSIWQFYLDYFPNVNFRNKEIRVKLKL